jgi:hypothetical protein
MRRLLLPLAALLALAFATSASASHSWGNPAYHWARTANPFTLRLVDTMTANWDDNLAVARTDWDASSVLNLQPEAGSDRDRDRKRCQPISGKVRSCNANYGFNGWLGLAQIWISNGVHIVQGIAKMNDSYLASSSYSETNRQHVICQEIGHDFGLGHQDESGADLNTCMDYARALDNAHPNSHDYQQLATIYNSHLDASNSFAASAATSGAKPTKVERSDRISDSTIVEHFADGSKKITHVFWALGSARAEHAHEGDE